LADIYCFEEAPMFVWRRIFEKLSRITFREFAQDHFKSEDSKISLDEIFVGKTQKRNLQLAQGTNELSHILKLPNLVINGKQYFGINQILTKSSEALELIESPWTIVHGDFCLSNILSEPDTNNIKMIDPRGGFDSASCFGPQIYDVAKLGHSLIGRFDIIIADKFILNLDRIKESEVSLEILESTFHSEIEFEYLTTYLNGHVDTEIAKLLSGLILLSIPGFHLDHSDRATAMLIQGIRICNEALEELG
jgi:hypothetical protein